MTFPQTRPTRTPGRSRPGGRIRDTLLLVPIRHGPLPAVIREGPPPREYAARVAGTTAALAAVVGAWTTTGSMTLAVFWAVFASYLVGSLFTVAVPGQTLRRLAVVLVTCSAGLLALAATTAAWGRSWVAIAVALVVGVVAQIVTALLLAPELLAEQRQRELGDSELR